MSRPQKPFSDRAFVDRLKEIAESLGSYAALAKKAGLAASTFQNYLDGGEPQRPALIALAEAANVSVSWLATGQGARNRNLLPEGYEGIPRFDLRDNIYPLMRGELTAEHSMLIDGPLRERIGLPLGSLTAAVISDGFPPAINDGDTIIYSAAAPGAQGRDIVISDGRFYLLAHGIKAVVRPLSARKGDGYFLTNRNGKLQPFDLASEYRILGRVHWRGGLV